jgi:hypothetical protein
MRSNTCPFHNEKTNPQQVGFLFSFWLCLHIMQHDIIFIEIGGAGRIIVVITTGGDFSIIVGDSNGF